MHAAIVASLLLVSFASAGSAVFDRADLVRLSDSSAASARALRGRKDARPLVQRLKELVAERREGIRAIYEDLHRHPELGMKETRTAALMAREMRALGFEVTEGVGGTGVVSVLRNGEGPVIMLRADMDGLPVQEDTGLPYASVVPGVMHACGHDVHMAASLGAAYALAGTRDAWQGTLVVVHQPAEEIIAGARAMIADGLFTRFPKPASAFAVHVSPLLAAGETGYAVGSAYSNADFFDITLVGRGGHGAVPQAAIDPVMMMTEVIQKLQYMIAREVDPLDMAVLSIGMVRAGTARNVIPETAELSGTMRTYGQALRDRLVARVEQIVNSVAALNNAPAPKIVWGKPYLPEVYNEPELVERTVPALKAIRGDAHVQAVRPVTPSEDFGVFGREGGFPSFIWWVGSVKDLAPPVYPNHSPRFAPVFAPTYTAGAETLAAAAVAGFGRR